MIKCSYDSWHTVVEMCYLLDKVFGLDLSNFEEKWALKKSR